jgi:hypothetical protein
LFQAFSRSFRSLYTVQLIIEINLPIFKLLFQYSPCGSKTNTDAFF